MRFNYMQKPNKLYYLKRDDLEDISSVILKDFSSKNLESPIPLDTMEFLEEYLGLSVKRKYIYSIESGVLGLIVMDDIAEIPSYDDMFRRTVIEETYGTVLISPQLIGKDNYSRRRYTEIHEGSHYLLHNEYYKELAKNSAAKSVASCIACRKVELIKQRPKTDTDWIEWQADGLAACLLMPKDVFCAVTSLIIKEHGLRRGYLISGQQQDKRIAYDVISKVSEIFQVSYKAAQIRMIHLGLIREPIYF